MLVATGAVAAAALGAAKLLRPTGTIDALVAVGVIASAEVTLLVGGLGAVGLLERGPVVAAAVAAAGAATLAARGEPALPLGSSLPDIGSATRRHPWVATLVALATIGLAWETLVGLVLPPYAFDGLTYHLSTAAWWVQHGDLSTNPLSLCCDRYPLTADLPFAWPMLLQGSDTLVDVVQVPFAILGALAIAGLARGSGLPVPAAIAAASLFTLTPVVLAQASTSYVDVIVVAWALCALHGLLGFRLRPSWRALVVPAIAIGLVLGTKGTGPVWAVVLGAALCTSVVTASRRRALDARLMPALALVVLLAGGLGSYWYARNWVDTRNPLYPFRIELPGGAVLDGPLEIDGVLTPPATGADEPELVSVARSWAHDLAFWRNGSYDYQRRQGGLGPLWAWVGLPLLVPWGLALLRRRDPMLVVVGIIAVVFLLQPYRWWSRFTLQLAGLGSIATAWAATASARAARPLRVAVVGLAAAGLALSCYEVDPAGRGEPLAALDVVRLIGDPADQRTIGQLFFPEYRFVDDIPEDAVVVVDLRASAVRFTYPFFGSDQGRTVLPARSDEPQAGRWIVTAEGRPLDDALLGDPRFELVSDVAGVRAWQPVSA